METNVAQCPYCNSVNIEVRPTGYGDPPTYVCKKCNARCNMVLSKDPHYAWLPGKVEKEFTFSAYKGGRHFTEGEMLDASTSFADGLGGLHRMLDELAQKGAKPGNRVVVTMTVIEG